MKVWLLGFGILALVSLGCCSNPNNCGSAGYGGLATTRVPPPGTTTYSAANMASLPPGTPGAVPATNVSGVAPATTTNSAVPLLPGADPTRPATTTPTITPGATSNPWQPATPPPATGTGYYGTPYNAGQIPSGFAAAPPGTAAASGYQTTTSTAASDPTRMPAVDATAVRAPVGMVQTTGSAAPLAVPGSMVYGGTPQVVATNPYGTPYGTPYGAGGYPATVQATNSNYVIAQASTKAMDTDPNYQNGWRTAGAPAPTAPR